MNTSLHKNLFIFNAVEKYNMSVSVEMMTEAELLKEYPQLPVARQSKGEIKFK